METDQKTQPLPWVLASASTSRKASKAEEVLRLGPSEHSEHKELGMLILHLSGMTKGNTHEPSSCVATCSCAM